MFGNVFRKYPYQDFNEYNLDWLLNRMKQLNDDFNSFTISNKLKYADPIFWNSAKSYDPNTMVVNGNTAYISLKPVPPGVSINDPEYRIYVLFLRLFEKPRIMIKRFLAVFKKKIKGLFRF